MMRIYRLPRRFRDVTPQPLPLFIPEHPASPLPASSPPISPTDHPLPARRSFCTPQNVFGLFRRYHSEKQPFHDLEEHVCLQYSSEGSPLPPPSLNDALFYPYPNESSFQLGEWYWNGVQKSREGFNRLVDIVGDPTFRSEDVRHTKWKGMDAKLAANDFDRSPTIDDDAQWMDENDGWQRTPISILVPFHHRTKKPGPRSFLVGDFYHRQPSDSHSNVRVHGELYTSPAFLEAHSELQDSP
jgi:hypothetical protein